MMLQSDPFQYRINLLSEDADVVALVSSVATKLSLEFIQSVDIWSPGGYFKGVISLWDLASHPLDDDQLNSVLRNSSYFILLVNDVSELDEFDGLILDFWLKPLNELIVSRRLEALIDYGIRSNQHALGWSVHETRKPLTLIMGHTSMLSVSEIADDPKAVRELGKLVNSVAWTGLARLRNALDTSAIVRGNMNLEIETCNIQDIIQQEMKSLNAMLFHDVEVSVTLEDNALLVTADVSHTTHAIRQVLCAVSSGFYPNDKESIPNSVSVTLVESNGFATITLLSSAKNAIDDVFDLYSGYDLTASKWIIEQQGGEMIYEEMPSGGSRYILSIPLADVEAPSSM